MACTNELEISVASPSGRITLRFKPLGLLFEPLDNDLPAFSRKNNKTLGETLKHRRYAKLMERIQERYATSLEEPLGTFLLGLKDSGDLLYTNFLNKHGDLKYCRFRVAECMQLDYKGLYVYVIEDRVQYIGRCRDSFRKRFNNGYGSISPKNCYIDGQSTNCHLNALVAAHRGEVTLFACPIESDDMIVSLEGPLIAQEQPPWNQSMPS